MKVALGQIAPIEGDVEANVARHIDFVKQAITDEADLIVFPELSLTGEKLGSFQADYSLTLESDVLQELCTLSNEIDIVLGLIEQSESNLYNRYNAAFYFSDCSLIHRHRKLFLVTYGVFEEGRHYVPGNNLQAFDTRLGRACMLLCNDIWHAPGPYIAALDGAEMLIVPANSARGTLQHRLDLPVAWDHLIRSYSAMMGFYTIFVNRVGMRRDSTGEYPYWGGSAIIGPDGEAVATAPYDEEALVIGEVLMERVAEQRYAAPIIRDARLWLFQQEFDRLAAKRSEAVRLPGPQVPVPLDGQPGQAPERRGD